MLISSYLLGFDLISVNISVDILLISVDKPSKLPRN